MRSKNLKRQEKNKSERCFIDKNLEEAQSFNTCHQTDSTILVKIQSLSFWSESSKCFSFLANPPKAFGDLSSLNHHSHFHFDSEVSLMRDLPNACETISLRDMMFGNQKVNLARKKKCLERIKILKMFNSHVKYIVFVLP